MFSLRISVISIAAFVISMIVKDTKMILSLIVLVGFISLSHQGCLTDYRVSNINCDGPTYDRCTKCDNITVNNGIFPPTVYYVSKRLIITESNIPVFSWNLIRNLSYLRYITLSNCGVKEIDDSPRISRVPSLISINLNHNEISKLPNNVFHRERDLNQLNLSHNCIEIIEPFFFNSSVQILDLSHNKMKVFPDAGLNTTLITIDLSYNEITKISNNQFDNFGNLLNLYMAHNNIERFEITTTNRIRTLDLSYNNIKDITYILKYFKQLAEVYLNNNLISEIPRGSFESLQFLRELYLGENKLHKIDSQIFMNSKLLRHLDLSNNPLNSTELNVSDTISTLTLRKNIFNITKIKIFEKLTHLDVSMTNSSVISIDAFTNNIDLEFLNLSYNKIEVLYTGTFTKLRRLKSLELTGNKLQVLPSGLFQQNLLRYLSIANNRLVSFNMASLNHQVTPPQINLDNNLWSCNTLTKIIHHLEVVVSHTTIVMDGDHSLEPNIRGNLCTLNSTEAETNVTIQQVLAQNLEVMRDVRDYLEDQEEINRMMINIFTSSKNNSLQNNDTIKNQENQTFPVLRTNADIYSAPVINKTENFVFVKLPTLTWLLSIQIILMLLITSVAIYYLKFRRVSVRNNGTLLDDMN